MCCCISERRPGSCPPSSDLYQGEGCVSDAFCQVSEKCCSNVAGENVCAPAGQLLHIVDEFQCFLFVTVFFHFQFSMVNVSHLTTRLRIRRVQNPGQGHHPRMTMMTSAVSPVRATLTTVTSAIRTKVTSAVLTSAEAARSVRRRGCTTSIRKNAFRNRIKVQGLC